MRRPDKSQISSKIPNSIRTLTDVKRKNFYDKIEKVINKQSNIEFMVDVFNNTSVFRSPDTIGISLFYPTTKNSTHSITEFFPIEMTTKDFTIELKRMISTIISKIPEDKKTGKLKEFVWE